MARDNGNTPAYTAPAGTEADATGERTAENTDAGTVTEAQAVESGAEVTEAPAVDTGVETEQGEDKSNQDRQAQEDAARKQAEEDAQARAESKHGLVTREANPEVGGESFPSFAPER